MWGRMAVALIALALLSPGAQASDGVDLTKGGWSAKSDHWEVHHNQEITIGGRIYTSYMSVYLTWGDCRATCEVVWRVPDGYSQFSASFGCISDQYPGGTPDVVVMLDGKSVKSLHLKPSAAAQAVNVPVSSGQSLAIKAGLGVIMAEPRFAKNNQPPQVSTADPKGTRQWTVFDELARRLRTKCDAIPSLKSRLKTSHVGVATFGVIREKTEGIAGLVRENMTTAMDNQSFQVVERSRMSDVLKELKLQDTALIDTATANKLGRQAGCTFLLTGSIINDGTKLQIHGRLVEVSTGRIVASDHVDVTKS